MKPVGTDPEGGVPGNSGPFVFEDGRTTMSTNSLLRTGRTKYLKDEVDPRTGVLRKELKKVLRIS